MGNLSNKEEPYGSKEDPRFSRYDIAPADEPNVFQVSRKDEFVGYLVPPDSPIADVALEIQQVWEQRLKTHEENNKDCPIPPTIIKKLVFDQNSQPVQFETDSESSADYSDYDDTNHADDYISSDEGELLAPIQKAWNWISGKPKTTGLPVVNKDVWKDKQTDTEEPWPSMDFSTPSLKEEAFGAEETQFIVQGNDSKSKLHNRRSQIPNHGPVHETENKIVGTCQIYFFKTGFHKNYDGWWVIFDPNFLNWFKWVRNKKMTEENILDEIKKKYQANLKKGGVFNEEQKIISMLNEKFCNQIRSTRDYLESAHTFISKTLDIMSNIRLENIEDVNLKADLNQLNDYAEEYHKHQNDWRPKDDH